jgi:hypothetical protein
MKYLGLFPLFICLLSIFPSPAPGWEFRKTVIGFDPNNAMADEAADVDGDGLADLVLTIAKTGVYMLKNRPGKDWGSRQLIYDTNGIVFSKTIDWDGDGDPDQILCEKNKPLIVFYENLGKAGYARHEIPAPVVPGYLEMVDWDRKDGLDVVLAPADRGPLWLITRDKSGTFTSVSLKFEAGQARKIRVADLDKDGDEDIFLQSGYMPQWAENAGGTFVLHPLYAANNEISDFEVADMDADGYPDVVVVGEQSKLALYRNQGDKTFTKVLEDSLHRADQAVIVDMDKDGDPDLVTATALGGDFHILENLGALKFKADSVHASVGGRAVVADVNGDGKPDLLYASYGDGTVVMRQTKPAGDYDSTAVMHPIGTVAEGIARDLDGDGDVDLALSGRYYGTALFVENIGGGYWVNHQLNSRPYTTFNINVADMDNDGDLDLLTSRFDDSGDVMLYLQTAKGVFEERVIPSSSTLANTARAVDLDGDHDLDIVAVSLTGSHLSWFENTGDGAYAEHSIAAGEGGCVDIDLVDIDHDGDMDILLACEKGMRFSVYRNDGKQKFTMDTLLQRTAVGSCIKAWDIDGDGDEDLLITGYDDQSVRVLLDTGSGRWAERVIADSLKGVEYIALDDVDHDGKLDILFASYAGRCSGVLLNRGGLNFVRRDFTAGLDGGSIAGIDFDGDGDEDVFSFNLVSEGSVIYSENISTEIPVGTRSGGKSPRRSDPRMSRNPGAASHVYDIRGRYLFTLSSENLPSGIVPDKRGRLILPIKTAVGLPVSSGR